MSEIVRDVDSEGIPFIETFEQRELKRLKFIRHLDQNVVTDVRMPQTPLAEIIPFIHVIDTASKSSVGEFFDRHRRRGPQRRPGDPPAPAA